MEHCLPGYFFFHLCVTHIVLRNLIDELRVFGCVSIFTITPEFKQNLKNILLPLSCYYNIRILKTLKE